MSRSFTAACVQFTAGPDPEANLRTVCDQGDNQFRPESGERETRAPILS